MIKNTFKNSIIKQLRDSFNSSSDTENYIFIGKVLPWENETKPPVYTDTILNEKDLRNNLLVVRKLFPENVAFCTRRINWAYNTVYDKFDDSVELYSDDKLVNFYVMNSQKNVYKCLDNNKGGASKVSPTGTESEIIILSDGYQWKYLYSISEELTKFITDEFIPIEFLDRLIYDSNDVRVDQLSAELDAKMNGKGKITSVVITQVGGSYPFSVEYDQDISTYVPEDSHFVQSYSRVSKVDTIYANMETGDLSRQDDFYNENYSVYFCKGPGAGQVRGIKSFNGQTGAIVLDEELTIQVTTQTMYKILPKITVIGDGSGALFIPKLNFNSSNIENIIVLSGGVGYSRASLTVKTSRVGVENQTLVRPIFTPYYGHSSNAFKELGCKNLMINTAFGYSDKNMNFYNDFRQVGIIQNPNIIGRLPQNNRVILDVESTSAKQEINVTLYNGQEATNASSYFNGTRVSKLLSTTITQGVEGTANYAVGIIDSYVNTQGVNGVLTVLSIQGKFMVPQVGGSIPALLVRDYPSGSKKITLNFTNSVAILSVKEKNYQSDSTFSVGSKIVSDISYSTGTVESWKLNEDRLSGELILKNVNGRFVPSHYDLSGTFHKGENIIKFSMDIKTPSILVNGGLPFTGTIKSILPQSVNKTDEIYSCMTKLDITRMAGVSTEFTSSTFTPDAYIQQLSVSGEVIAKGVVIDWSINTTDTTKTSGVLLVNTVFGNFVASTNRNIYQYSTVGSFGINTGYVNVKDTIVCTVIDSEVEMHTGDVIHAQNIIRIGHGNDSLEEIKLVIGF
jgi:hypothetical protein